MSPEVSNDKMRNGSSGMNVTDRNVVTGMRIDEETPTIGIVTSAITPWIMTGKGMIEGTWNDTKLGTLGVLQSPTQSEP